MRHSPLRTHRLIGAILLLTSASLSAEISSRIVDFGHDWGVGWFREDVNGLRGSRTQFQAVDLDGDGDVSDDSTAGWDFDLVRPLSPTNSRYDSTLPNATFYGGVIVQVSNIAGERARGPSEGHINQNHELRDDWNMMSMSSIKKQPELESYKAAGIWLWPKEDFLNEGDQYSVSFKGDDYIAVFISRYFGGVDWGRWVIQDGEDFYISEDTFANVTEAFTVRSDSAEDGAKNPVVRKSHVIHPAETKWAHYDPKPAADFYFDDRTSTYQKVSFSDVRSIGFIVQRALSQGQPAAKALSLMEPIALKFNAVQAVATIDRKPESSAYVNLAPNTHSSELISYDQWTEVVKWAVTNQRASNFPEAMQSADIGGYTFLRDGLPGFAAVSSVEEVSTDAPVSMITLLDAMAWCNALSELEGREPVYYTDEAHSIVLRSLADRSKLELFATRPTVYWKTDASGYRLPTATEVISNSTNYEYAWPTDDADFKPSSDAVIAIGKSAKSPENSALLSDSMPFSQGDPRLGFRVILGMGAPEKASKANWSIRPETVLKSSAPVSMESLRNYVSTELKFKEVPDAGSLPTNENYRKDYNKNLETTYTLEMCASEVPYSIWNAVRLWSTQAKGYQFNHLGAPGSVRYRTLKEAARSVSLQEPVVNITWMDAIVWCNALSELMNLEPVYLNADTGRPMKHSSPFRLECYAPYHYPNEGREKQRAVDTAAIINVKVDTSKNGFRLPSKAEMEVVAPKSGAPTRAATAHTETVQSGAAIDGFYGLYSNAAEWTYGGDRLFGQWIFGSDFSYPDGKMPHQMNSKDHPFANRSYLSFRPVRKAE